MSAATPEWAELLQDAVAAGLFELHTGMPGQVVAVHSDAKSKRQFVDVRPCLRRALEGDEDSVEPFVEENLPVLPRVPVGYPQGGGFFVSFPLEPGDFVYVVFAERSIDRFIATATKARQAAVSTGDVGTHSLDGAIALPMGPAPLAELLEGVSATDLVIGLSGGTTIHVKPNGEIHLGSNAAADYVALAALVKSELQALWDALDTHTHVVATTGSSSAQSGTAAAQTGPLGLAGDVKATKVKAD